jgi:hypothetical protein
LPSARKRADALASTRSTVIRATGGRFGVRLAGTRIGCEGVWNTPGAKRVAAGT